MKVKMAKHKRAFVILLMAMVMMVSLFGNTMTTYAATTKVITTKNASVVCGNYATIKNVSGTKYTYTSSNSKVATISKTGKIKANKLGVTKITAKKGNVKKTYNLTIIPAKKSDVMLNRHIVLEGENTTLKLVSKKYDTSQVKLSFAGNYYDELSNSGKWTSNANTDSYWSSGEIAYSYGNFYGTDKFYTVSYEAIKKNFFAELLANQPLTGGIDTYSRVIRLNDLAANGIKVTLNGAVAKDKQVLAPGTYNLVIAASNYSHKESLSIHYSIKDTLDHQDASGFPKEKKAVFDAAFKAVDEIITPGMSDKEKVQAIHDFLIYGANYYNGGDPTGAPGWAFSAKGVLLNHEGVCNSYAIAFCMMCRIAGLDCRYVSGYASGGSHAWNRVKIDGSWYYIDCTWDDPGAGGYENEDYFLSPTVWSNHTWKEEHDLVNDSEDFWFRFYLCGEGWDNN